MEPKRGERRVVHNARITGVIALTAKGVGYVEHEKLPEDVEIDPGNLNTALHRDTVEVLLLPRDRRRRQQGRVVRVVSRAKTSFVGTLSEKNGAWHLVPDDRKMYVDIAIPKAPANARGMKALVKIAHWSDPAKNPEGEVLEVIGPAGANETEMRAIVLARGFATGFPEDVLKEAEAIPHAISPKEAARRRDFRSVPTFTIDPEDAKDFDDALSVRRLPDGTHEIGIHIADVSHYVKPGSAIDREAVKRGTSIYLVDRTIPMLPEVLSNELCSLKPLEDRLAFSAVVAVDENGKILSRWFGETIIHSKKRFTYEEAQNVLDAGSGPFAGELAILNRLGKKLRERREKEGAIAFGEDEVKFKLDDKGKPVGVYKKERLDTNLLVEDWMLLANREVAEWVYKRTKSPERNVAFVYRIHDAPDPEKIDELAAFLKAIGYDLKVHKGAVSSRDLNRLFKEIEGTPEEGLVKTATIRSMAKAIYSTKNIGHFGLAFRYYTHFTSPIRRYPDVMAHRVMKRHLGGGPISAHEFAHYERLAIQSSEREVAAVAAERESVKLKQVEFLTGRVGETFEGVVSGVAEWGLYVEEKETKAEGLVRVRTMKDDYYLLDEKNYRLVGERTKKVYRLGDPVKVKLALADPETKTIDWVLA